MEALAGLLLGYALANRREILSFFKSKRLRNEPAAPVSRILKPFTTAAKRKPKINDDQKAWAREQEKDLEK